MNAYKFNQWPVFGEDEINRVTSVLRSGKVNYWTGTETRNFEEEFSRKVACKYGIALSNGTVALELALRTGGIGQGDEVIVSPRSFFASASSIVTCGARPVFADVDAFSQNITAKNIEDVLSEKTRAVICVHLAGWPCEMEPIMKLADEHNLFVIEDCAQAHGACYKGRPVGSFGHASAWSFCQDKIMTTGGEGGMLTTNDHGVWQRGWSYKDHGKSWDAVYKKFHPIGFRWLHDNFGTNFRMTEIQAAIGRMQLKKLDEWVKIRRRNAGILHERFKQMTVLRVTEPEDGIYHAYYKYYVFIHPKRLKFGWDRDSIMKAVNDAGIPCMSGICPEIYQERAFDNIGDGRSERLAQAKVLGETSIMLLVHPTLGEDEMIKTADTVEMVLEQAHI